MKALSDTSLYKYLETVSGSKMSRTLAQLIDENSGAKFIQESQLEDVLYKIRHKSFNFRGKFAVIDLFRKGSIKLVYNPNISMTTAIPFFAFKMPNGKLGVIVNITHYSTIDNDGSVKIDPLVLYSLCLAASFALRADAMSGVLANSGVADLYADLFIAVLARMSNLDMPRREKIKFIMAKFMYMNLGLDELRASQASKQSLKYIDEYTLETIDAAIPINAYSDLETLVNTMKETMLEMKGVTFGLLFDKWIKMYGEPSCFALEYVPLLIFMFICLVTNCNGIMNVKAIENVATKDARKLQLLFDRIEVAVQNMSNM